MPIAPICYWDEADRIPKLLLAWSLRSARRRRATIVAGTHVDLASAAGRHGFAVTTVHLDSLPPESLQEWCRLRIAAVAEPGCRFEVPPDVVTDIANRCGGSLRVAADRLHIWTANHALSR